MSSRRKFLKAAGAGVAGRAEFPAVLAGDECGWDMDGGQRGAVVGGVDHEGAK